MEARGETEEARNGSKWSVVSGQYTQPQKRIADEMRNVGTGPRARPKIQGEMSSFYLEVWFDAKWAFCSDDEFLFVQRGVGASATYIGIG